MLAFISVCQLCSDNGNFEQIAAGARSQMHISMVSLMRFYDWCMVRPLSVEEQKANVQSAVSCNDTKREVTVLNSLFKQADKTFTFDKVKLLLIPVLAAYGLWILNSFRHSVITNFKRLKSCVSQICNMMIIQVLNTPTWLFHCCILHVLCLCVDDLALLLCIFFI